MGRRRKHDGDSGLASDQIPVQNQNNTTRNKPCHSLLHHHQAFRGGTRIDSSVSPYEMQAGDKKRQSVRRGIGHRTLRKQRNGMQAVEMQGRLPSHH